MTDTKQKPDEVPEWVWCDEDVWDWQRYLMGLPDADVKRMIEKIKHQIIQMHSMSYQAGFEDGVSHAERDIRDELDAAWESGRERGWEDRE